MLATSRDIEKQADVKRKRFPMTAIDPRYQINPTMRKVSKSNACLFSIKPILNKLPVDLTTTFLRSVDPETL